MARRPWFKAATWNLRYDVPAKRQRRVLRRLRGRGVSIILAQEFEVGGIAKVFRSEGWEVARFGTCAVAWRPEVWPTRQQTVNVALSVEGFPRVGGQWWRPLSPLVRLIHKSGRSLDVLSYHLPAGVQAKGDPSGARRRLAVTRESLAMMRELAELSKADAVLFGGDDNVDESRGKGWGFMRRWSTGLRLVQPPRGTHGSRKIDDFRVRRLKPLKGWTIATPGDHRAHIRRFRWRR